MEPEPNIVVEAFIGTEGRAGRSSGVSRTIASLDGPNGLALMSSDALVIADELNDRLAKIVLEVPTTVSSGSSRFEIFENPNNAGVVFELCNIPKPSYIAHLKESWQTDHYFFVTSTTQHTLQCVKLDKEGYAEVTLLAGTAGKPGDADGHGHDHKSDFAAVEARFHSPMGIFARTTAKNTELCRR